MELNEVSEIEIKTFSVRNFKEFCSKNLHDKLDELEGLIGTDKEKSSTSSDAIGLGDAFQTAMNEMFNCKGEVARIIEKRVITLDKTICKEKS
jgi:hypothetical protein